jgi:hypothetical protein
VISFINSAKYYTGWILKGFLDSAKNTVSGHDGFSFKKALVSKMDECEPWTNTFLPSALGNLRKAYAEKDFTAMRLFADIGVTEDYNPYCLELAKLTINLLAKGLEIEVTMVSFLE